MRMMIAALLLLVPGAVAAQERVSIELSSFKFTPKTITLHHGQHYVLHFANTSDGGHDFVAKSSSPRRSSTSPDRSRTVRLSSTVASPSTSG